MRKRILQFLAAVAAVGLLGACTASTDPDAAADPSGEETTSASPTVEFAPDASSTDEATPASSPDERAPAGEIEAVPALVDGWDGILADVTVDSCPTVAGQVTAEGAVINSADDDRDIAIVISWNAPDSTNSILQLAVTEAGVPPGGP